MVETKTETVKVRETKKVEQKKGGGGVFEDTEG